MTQAFPLQWPNGWPRMSSHGRKRAKFHTSGRTWGTGKQVLTIADGAARIVGELRTLGVGDGKWVISSNLELRNDGLPRSNQPPPTDPGIAVYWTRKGKQNVMAIDIYDRVADNLAAIAATLSALRAIERHGGAQILERAFEGFAALPGPDTVDPWAVLGLRPGASKEEVETKFRTLSKTHHPDAGGSTDAFQKLQRARALALSSQASP